MHGIALLLVVAASAQAPPPDEPPPLKRNERSYEIKVGPDEWWYVRAYEDDFDAVGRRGEFVSDEPEPKFQSRQTLEFEDFNQETEAARKKRWKEAAHELAVKHGFVRVEFADGSMNWVTKEEADWADRARTAAKQVIEQQETRESLAMEGPTLNAPEESETDPSLGLLQLWGPQIAVGILMLVLMGVAVRLFFMPEGTGWQKLD